MEKLKRKFFMSHELTEDAFKTYSNCSFVFFQDSKGVYYFAEYNKSNERQELGTIDDVEEFLKELAE